jgi:hypothetical protein
MIEYEVYRVVVVVVVVVVNRPGNIAAVLRK